MKKKNKKKIKKKLRKLKNKKTPKLRKKKVKKFKKRRIVRSKKRTKKPRKTIRKKTAPIRKKKISLKTSLFSFNKIKIPKFKKQGKHVIKSSFQKVINFVLQPFFRAYDDFREKRKIEKLRKIALEKKEKERQIKEERRLRYEAKQQELKDEIQFAKDRSQDIKQFIREGQALLRKEQSEKKRKFLEELKLSRKIEAFRKRELLEIKNLEKIALREKILEFKPIQERIEQIKEKYKKIREQKIKERIESLGIEVLDTDTKADLLQKEREYAEQRQKIETILESFYRGANSLVFQLNKRYIPKHKSILRVIDRRYEENLCFIRYDDVPDENFLMLIYLEDSNPAKETIIVEDKTNEEKHVTKSFKPNQIFAYSDYLVDQFTSHLDREFKKQKAG